MFSSLNTISQKLDDRQLVDDLGYLQHLIKQNNFKVKQAFWFSFVKWCWIPIVYVNFFLDSLCGLGV